jgi:hypothetical protein
LRKKEIKLGEGEISREYQNFFRKIDKLCWWHIGDRLKGIEWAKIKAGSHGPAFKCLPSPLGQGRPLGQYFLFEKDQSKVVPATKGLFASVDVEAVVSGGFEDIDAAGLHHGPDPEFG